LSGACVYSKIFRDISLVGPNAISKNANNVVNSGPSVFIFSQIVDLVNLIRYIRSRDHIDFRFGRQGAPKNFFRIRFSRQPLVRFPKFFQGRVPPDGPNLSSGGHGGRGSNLGSRPPEVKFFCFLCSNRHGSGGRNMPCGDFKWRRPLRAQKLKTKFDETFSRKWCSNILGGVALFRVRPLGGLPSPICPLEILALGTLTKIVFVRGRLPPIRGRYEFWPVCTLAHFFSKSYRQILEISSRSLARTACYRF